MALSGLGALVAFSLKAMGVDELVLFKNDAQRSSMISARLVTVVLSARRWNVDRLVAEELEENDVV